MKFVFIVLFLVTFGSVCMAGAGDVYFCQVEKNMAYEKDRIIRGGQFKFKFGILTSNKKMLQHWQ